MNISVVGLGKLGLPLAAVLSAAGFTVVGVDLDPDLVDRVSRGDVGDEPGLAALLERAPIAVTTDIGIVSGTKATFVVVPTPSGPDGRFMNRYVEEAVSAVRNAGPDVGHLTVIVSTVMPGTTAMLQHFTQPDLSICYNPAFIALGDVLNGFRSPDFVLIGESGMGPGDLLESIWRRVLDQAGAPPAVVRRMPLVDAELTKITVNAMLVDRISWANAVSEIADAIGADGRVVMAAVGLDHRIGPALLRPGGPAAGPCLPRDCRAFAMVAPELVDATAPALAAEQTNEYQYRRVLREIRKAGPGRRVGVLGLAYKPGTDVVERSLGLHLVMHEHAVVAAYDPAAGGGNQPDAESCVAAVDTVVIATPWPEFADLDYTGKTVIDPWGVLR